MTHSAKRLDELVELRPERSNGVKEPARPYIGLEHIAQGTPKLLGSLPSSESISTNNQFERDDILFGKLRPNLRKSIRAPFAGYCSTDILVLRAREGVAPAFAGHVFQWENVFNAAMATAAGTKMPRTSWNELRRFRVCCPDSSKEQSSVATVLNAVDAAIAKTEAVIEKLKHVRSGLQHDLLTRGLDDNGELRDPAQRPQQFKDCPFGRIPKSWSFSVLSDVLEDIDAGKSPDYGDYPAPPGEWGVLKVSAIWPNSFRPHENKWVTKKIDQVPAFTVRDGDLLISRSNTYALVGIACLVSGDHPRLMLCDKTLRLSLRPDRGLNPYFALLLQTRNVRAQIEVNATGTSGSMKNISQEVIRCLRLAYPGVDEQQDILDKINPVQKHIQSVQEELSKIEKLKSGLMSDLLTGRVPVPETIATEIPA